MITEENLSFKNWGREMGTVYLIGGCPLSGKTTVSMQLASYLQTMYCSTDDISEIFQIASKISFMHDLGYKEYYQSYSLDKLIGGTKVHHGMIQSSLNRLIEIHTQWSASMLMEGWALYPEHYHSIPYTKVKRIWLIAQPEIIRERLLHRHLFDDNSNDVFEKYFQRTLWHNRYIFEQCQYYNEEYLLCESQTTPAVLQKKILDLWANKS